MDFGPHAGHRQHGNAALGRPMFRDFEQRGFSDSGLAGDNER
jgi:hypothetical protein